jgi:transcriptional regulator with XRE-family HTH domain
MDELQTTELKAWREKQNMSQAKLARIAKISLQTLRQLEVGAHKPRGSTLRHLLDAIKGVETGAPEILEQLIDKRRGRKIHAEPAPLAGGEAGEAPAPKRRGRPPKVRLPGEEAPVRRGRPPKALTAPTPAPAPLHIPPLSPSPFRVSPEAGRIRLSNLDLELINRILNMTAREKLDLLRRLTQG